MKSSRKIKLWKPRLIGKNATVTEVESFLKKGNKALEKECERMESINEKMDKELARKEATKLELERRVQEAEEKRKSVEAKYETSL